jgi:hypothetical protein
MARKFSPLKDGSLVKVSVLGVLHILTLPFQPLKSLTKMTI